MREQLQDQFKKVGMLQAENEQLSFNLETVRNELEKSREIHKKQIDGFTEQIKELMHSVEHHKGLHKRALEDHENNAKDMKAKYERDHKQTTIDHDEFVEKMKEQYEKQIEILKAKVASLEKDKELKESHIECLTNEVDDKSSKIEILEKRLDR